MKWNAWMHMYSGMLSVTSHVLVHVYVYVYLYQSKQPNVRVMPPSFIHCALGVANVYHEVLLEPRI